MKPASGMHVVLPPIGLGYLASYCQKESPDIDLRILDCHRERFSQDRFAEYIQEYRPDIIGFTAFSMEIKSALDLVNVAKNVVKNVAIVLGGPHASSTPHSLLANPFIDYVFVGEAEYGFSYFVRHFYSQDRFKAPGLGYRNGGGIVINEPKLVVDLDEIPFPDYKKMQFEKYPKMYFMKYFPAAPMMSSRGCPYNCTFCAGHKVSGRRWRARSVGNIMKEVEYLKKEYGIREIDFWDDNFAFDKKRVEEFCRLLNLSGDKIKWWCPNGVHINTVDKDLLAVMRESGCYAIAFGVESGSERIRDEMQKHISMSRLEEMVEFSNRIGLRTQGFFIIGYPEENEEDILKTIRISRSLPFLRASFCLFQPIIGSEIYDRLINEKAIDEKHLGLVSCDYSKVSMPTRFIKNVSRIKRLQRKAIIEFYFRPKVLLRLLFENMSFSQIKELLSIVKKYVLGR